MKFNCFSVEGASVGQTDVDNFPILDDEKGVDALRQVILATRANKRQGNASTKSRDEVSGSGKKIYRQKGLGTGRAGDKRAIQRRGGGVAFGPKPRSYTQKINSKMKKLALVRSLVDHARQGSISLIEEWKIDTPKTKEFSQLLSLMHTTGGKLLIVNDLVNVNLSLASRNIPKVSITNALDMSASDLFSADNVLFSVNAMNILIKKLS